MVILVTVAIPVWSGNLINNGSFTMPGGTTTNGYIDNGTQNMPGWTGGKSGALDCYVVTNTNQFCGYATFATNEGLSPNGGAYVMFDADPTYGSTLSQTVSGLIVGKFYKLSFYQAADHQSTFTGATNLSFSATLGTQKLTAASPNPTTVDAAWQFVYLIFTASATTETLTFSANGPTGGPPILLLDGVSLTQVPEPAEWTLVAIGGLLLFLGTKLKKRRPVTPTAD